MAFRYCNYDEGEWVCPSCKEQESLGEVFQSIIHFHVDYWDGNGEPLQSSGPDVSLDNAEEEMFHQPLDPRFRCDVCFKRCDKAEHMSKEAFERFHNGNEEYEKHYGLDVDDG